MRRAAREKTAPIGVACSDRTPLSRAACASLPLRRQTVEPRDSFLDDIVPEPHFVLSPHCMLCLVQLNDRLLAQLDIDRRRRYAASSPMPKIYNWWMRRLIMTLILTAFLPVVCWWLKEFEKAHSHHAHDDHGEGHGNHGGAHDDGHGGHDLAAHGHSDHAEVDHLSTATHHRLLSEHNGEVRGCVDDPEWLSPDSKYHCSDYESK